MLPTYTHPSWSCSHPKQGMEHLWSWNSLVIHKRLITPRYGSYLHEHYGAAAPACTRAQHMYMNRSYTRETATGYTVQDLSTCFSNSMPRHGYIGDWEATCIILT
jgi:hypothetical protein